MEKIRKYGYDILVNHFEAFLREFISNDILVKNFHDDWRDYIPNHIINRLADEREVLIEDLEINDFFQELLFSDLYCICYNTHNDYNGRN